MKPKKTIKFRVHQKGTRWYQSFNTSASAILYIGEALTRNSNAKFSIQKITTEELWSI